MSGEVQRCSWCGGEVNHSAAIKCDRCWELERRILDRPDLTLQMLAHVRQKPMCSCGALSWLSHVDGCPVGPTAAADQAGKPFDEAFKELSLTTAEREALVFHLGALRLQRTIQALLRPERGGAI